MSGPSISDFAIRELLQLHMAPGLPAMEFEIFSSHHDDRVRFIGFALDESVRVERTIIFNHHILHCGSTHINRSHRGRGLGRQVMVNSARLANAFRLDTMKMMAVDEGRHAWACVGFQADEEFWDTARKALLDSLVKGDRFVDSPDRELAASIIESKDPLALHSLTRLKSLVPAEAGGQDKLTTFGRALLTSIPSWRGTFDLSNRAYTQLLARLE